MARLPFIGIPGAPKSDGATVSVVARTNAALTWSCFGKSGSVTLTALSSDGPSTPCYTGSFTITGLPGPGLTQYSVILTQSGISQTSKFRITPDLGQKYRVAAASHSTTTGIVADSPHETDVNSINDTPLVCIILTDDINQSDTVLYDDSAGTGLVMTGFPNITLKQFDWAVAWMEWFGMLGDGVSPARVKMLTECNHALQFGNHEFASDVTGNGYIVYAAFFAATGFKPTSIANLDATALGWALTLGNVKFVAPDGESRQDGTYFLGNNQVDDVLAALSTAQPIKLLMLNHPPKNVTDGTYSASRAPFETKADYARLLTTATTSLSALTQTNGVKGCCIITAGDQHIGQYYRAVAPAGAGTVAEAFGAWELGGYNGSGHSDGTSEDLVGGVYVHTIRLNEGSTYNNCNLLYTIRNPGTATNYTDPRGTGGSWTHITVHGDEYPLRVSLEARRNLNGIQYSAFTRHWTQWLTDNYGTATPVRKERTSFVSKDA